MDEFQTELKIFDWKAGFKTRINLLSSLKVINSIKVEELVRNSRIFRKKVISNDLQKLKHPKHLFEKPIYFGILPFVFL